MTSPVWASNSSPSAVGRRASVIMTIPKTEVYGPAEVLLPAAVLHTPMEKAKSSVHAAPSNLAHLHRTWPEHICRFPCLKQVGRTACALSPNVIGLILETWYNIACPTVPISSDISLEGREVGHCDREERT